MKIFLLLPKFYGFYSSDVNARVCFMLGWTKKAILIFSEIKGFPNQFHNLSKIAFIFFEGLFYLSKFYILQITYVHMCNISFIK